MGIMGKELIFFGCGKPVGNLLHTLFQNPTLSVMMY
jgi:hypothetical protein